MGTRSFRKNLDAKDIAQQIRFERTTHKGSFLVVEGDTDIKRFAPLIDNSCSLVNAFGRDNALGSARILEKEGFMGLAACVDSDFHRLLGTIEVFDDILYSSKHDFDSDWILSGVLSKYLREVGDPAKIRSLGGVDAVLDRVKNGLKPVSITRLLNHQQTIKFKVNHVDVSKCFSNFRVDFDAYYRLLCDQDGYVDLSKDDLWKAINPHLTMDYDIDQITNGHDICCALGASLRSDIGKRRDVHTWGSEVEMHIRLTFQRVDLKMLHLFGGIRVWEHENAPFRILSADF